jgi:hypothetical protein
MANLRDDDAVGAGVEGGLDRPAPAPGVRPVVGPLPTTPPLQLRPGLAATPTVRRGPVAHCPDVHTVPIRERGADPRRLAGGGWGHLRADEDSNAAAMGG